MIKRAAFVTKLHTVGRSSLATSRDLRAGEALDPQRLAELTDRRTAEHARFAMRHSRFYRDLYTAAGLTDRDLDDPAVVGALPFVDKALVRDHFAEITSDEATPSNSSVSSTGGSTGTPLRLLRDDRFPARALEWRLFEWWGVNPWDDRAIITRHMLSGRAKLRHDLQWLPSRRVQLDAFAISDESVTRFAAQWRRRRPTFLVGYAGGVLDVARRLDRLGLQLPVPDAIAVTAAPLTPGVREEIENVFGAPVYDHYRAAEVPWIAGECAERAGMHVFADVRRVEILDDDDVPVAPGVEGNVVVTDLTNKVFPLIRYRLGDLSSIVPEPCACGRALPRLGAISGRRSDAVRLPDGTTIAGALGHVFDHAPLAVRQFEIVQDRDYSVTLRYVPGPGAAQTEAIEDAHRTLRTATRGLVPVRLEAVDHIEQTGGKMRFIRSDAPTSP